MRRLASAGPILDGVVVGALVASDLTAQTMATAGTDVSSAELGVAAVMLAAISAANMWWRRRRPLTVLAGVVALVPLTAAAIEPGLFTQLTGTTAVLALYAVGAWSEHRRRATAVPIALVVVVIAGALGDGTAVASSVAIGLALVPLPWALGYAARVRRQYVLEVERRLVDAERERDVRARRAVLDERAHIARELHDVVAHHVSLIGVQAGAARTSLDGSPVATRAALQAIEAASRAAVGEMRHVLDALRDDAYLEQGSASIAPQPRLADLDRLLEGFRGAGVAVALRCRTEAVALPPLIELCCYRIVEEALTNVTRHSSASAATVDVDHRDRLITLAVTDPGPSRPGRGDGGRGLIGMRERVALFGGTLSVGPTRGGGFAVVAQLPVVRIGAPTVQVEPTVQVDRVHR